MTCSPQQIVLELMCISEAVFAIYSHQPDTLTDNWHMEAVGSLFWWCSGQITPRFNLTFAVYMSQWLDKCVLSFLPPVWQQKSFEQRKTERREWDTPVCATLLTTVTEHMAYQEGMLKTKISLGKLLTDMQTKPLHFGIQTLHRFSNAILC